MSERSPCPWCLKKLIEHPDRNYIYVCEKCGGPSVVEKKSLHQFTARHSAEFTVDELLEASLRRQYITEAIRDRAATEFKTALDKAAMGRSAG
jgi:hypothetical protein